MFSTMRDFANSLAAFYADVIATALPVTVSVGLRVRPQRARERQRRHRSRARDGACSRWARNIAGGRVIANWPGLAADQLEDGQDLRVTIDYRDILAEIVPNRLGNSRMSALVFPGWTPTFRGVTR